MKIIKLEYLKLESDHFSKFLGQFCTCFAHLHVDDFCVGIARILMMLRLFLWSATKFSLLPKIEPAAFLPALGA